MITSKEQNDRLVKALVSSGAKKQDYFSYSAILNQIGDDNLVEIIANYDNMMSLFQTEKVLLAEKIGVKKPTERKHVIDELAKYAIKNITETDITDINKFFEKNEISYRLSKIKDLDYVTKKSFSLNTGLKNLQFIKYIAPIGMSFQYAKRYLKSDIESLSKTSSRLEEVIVKMGKNPTDIQALEKLTQSTLLKLGYPEVAVKEKDPGQLANIIFREMVGSKAVMQAKQKNQNPTEDNVKDEVALIIMQKLK